MNAIAKSRTPFRWVGKDGLIIVLDVILLILVFMTGILDRQQTWPDLNYSDVPVTPSICLSTENGDEYGIHSSGPFYDLPRGNYRLKLTIETDGSGSVHLSDANHARITPDVLTFQAEDTDPDWNFRIEDTADNLNIQISFDSGTYLNVYDIRLYTPFYRDYAFTFALILLLGTLLFLLYSHNYLSPADLRNMLILATAVVVCSSPVLKDNVVNLIDLEFHMARIENLADGLRSGQFPVRAGGFSFNGYGAITSVFYPDLLLTPFALLRNLGASPTYVVSLFCIVVTALAGLFAYLAASAMAEDKNAGTCAAILYIACAYRLNNLFVRGALGEGMAMSFYPIFIHGLWETVFGDKNRWRLLAAGAFLIFMSHLISTVMALLMAIGVCVLAIPRILRERRLVSILKAALATVCLSLFFLVPMVETLSKGINAEVINIYRLQDKTISVAQLFLQSRGLLPVLEDPTVDTGAVELGLPLVIGVMLVLYLSIKDKEDAVKKDDSLNPERQSTVPLLILSLVGIGFAFMTTTLFPWAHVSQITLFFNQIQFAWRFIGPSVALLALCSGIAYSKVFSRIPHYPVLLLIFALTIILPTMSEQTRKSGFFRFGEGTSGNIRFNEYQIPGTNLDDTVNREPILSGTLSMENYKKDGNRIDATITETGTEGGSIEFPLFAFDGYTASMNGKELQVEKGLNNRVRVNLDANESGVLRIRYKTKTLWRLMDLLSLISCLFLILTGMRRRFRSAQRGFRKSGKTGR